MIEFLFFQEIILVSFGGLIAFFTAVIIWYGQKRETCNRRKEDLMTNIDKTLTEHLAESKFDRQMLVKISERIDNLKNKNKLIE